MTSRPECPKGQRKQGSPCVFCGDGSYCAHQYYCPTTRRYENTGWRECRREPCGGYNPQSPTATAPLPKEPYPTGDEGALADISRQHDNENTPENNREKEEQNGTQKTDKRRRRKG